MTNRTLAGIAVLALSQGQVGCGGSSPSAAPSPVPQPVPSTYTLSGVVLGMTSMGLAPVGGASVQVNLVKAVTTDSNGFYSIPGLTLTGLAPNTPIGNFNTVTAWKPSYINDTRTVTISGDTRLDIQLVRRATFTLSGVVSEMTETGPTPVEGVQIDDWSCDPAFPGNRPRNPSDGCLYGLPHSTTTDSNGRDSIPGVYATVANSATQNFVCATATKTTCPVRNRNAPAIPLR